MALARNVEFKCALPARQVPEVRARALTRSDRAPQVLHQTDTFFIVPTGRLKLRTFGDGTGELIAYERPNHPGLRTSAYTRVPTADPATLRHALAATLGVRGVVEKHRDVIHIGQARVHLDAVAGLGAFLELEVVLRGDQSPADGEAVARALLKSLALEEATPIGAAYIDLLEGVV